MENLTQIQKEIKDTLHKFNEINKLVSHLGDLDIKISQTSSEILKLDKTLDKELKDIEKLESMGVKSLFHKVLGSQESQLDKERQEYLQASLKYKEYTKRLQILNFEKSLLDKKVINFTELKHHLISLKEARKNEILKSNNSLKERLLSILEENERCIMLNKEIGEASIEGAKCIKLLNVVLSYLKKARDWGTWNNSQSKRGSYQKNRAIDYAVNNLSKAQVQLDIFIKELSDLGSNNVSLQLSKVQFNQFTDFFFDNLISDWIIQQRIRNTVTNVETVLSKIQRIVLSLNEEEKINKQKSEQLAIEQNQILLL